MKTYLITYELKSPDGAYTSLINAIKAYRIWWHYLKSTWIICTEETIESVNNALHVLLKGGDLLLVVDITGRDRNGWLPQKAWEWLRNNNPHQN